MVNGVTLEFDSY